MANQEHVPPAGQLAGNTNDSEPLTRMHTELTWVDEI